MSTAYRGRHSGGLHRTRPVGRVRATAHGFSHVLRRPVASAAAILAVAGVSAAASSHAAPSTSSQSFTASPMAAEQAAELSLDSENTNVSLAAARRSGVQRSVALMQSQQAAADALVQARAQATAALIQARAAAAALVSRAQARQAILARAQSDPKAVASLLAADRGWTGPQFTCLDSVWTKESGWQWNATNSSGAYGIPQSLPADKMASAGSDWSTNPITQITWGLQYIASVYGTPCSAWSHEMAVNWY